MVIQNKHRNSKVYKKADAKGAKTPLHKAALIENQTYKETQQIIEVARRIIT